MKTPLDFHVTPKPIALQIAALIPDAAIRILDPCAGTGVLLEAVRELDINCCRSLYFYEIQEELPEAVTEYAVKVGDSFDGEHPEDYFDAVIANPPYSELTGEGCWIDQITDSVKEGGSIIMLLPNRLITTDFENLSTVSRLDLGLVDFGTAKVNVFIYRGTKVKGTKKDIKPTVIPTKCTTQLGLVFEDILLSFYGYTVNRVEKGSFLKGMEIGNERSEGLTEYRVIFDEFKCSEHPVEESNDSDGYCAYSVFIKDSIIPTIDDILFEGYRVFNIYTQIFKCYLQEPYEFVSETPIQEVNEFLQLYFGIEKDFPDLQHLRIISYRLYKDFKAFRFFTFKNYKVTKNVTEYLEYVIRELE